MEQPWPQQKCILQMEHWRPKNKQNNKKYIASGTFMTKKQQKYENNFCTFIKYQTHFSK